MKKTKPQIPDCKKYSGYKPCIPYKNCLEKGCAENRPENRTGKKILLLNLDALGNVLLNTSVLPAIKRKYPQSTIHWITKENARPILENNPRVDRIFQWSDEHRMIVRNVQYDLLLNADKSDYACAFANEVRAKRKLGFLLNSSGKIIPANEGSMYNYRMGVDDNLKFRINKRTGIDIIHESFDLDFRRDEYSFSFNDGEKESLQIYKKSIKYDPKLTYVGFNTGCSTLFPNKKLTVDQHITIIKKLLREKKYMIVLLGGAEDTERNNQILRSIPKPVRKRVISTPTETGIRKGACFMEICDIVVTGDSFGMHLAIALRKHVIAWFGLSCWTEIELYGRGEKLIPEGLECAPCWKKVCPYNLECIKMVDPSKIIGLVRAFSGVRKR